MKNITKQLISILFFAAAAAGLSACDTDPVEQKGGKLPDKEPLENVYGMLRSAKTSDRAVDVLLAEGSGTAQEALYFQQTQPAAGDLTLDLRIDGSLVEAYNAAEEVERKLLPETGCEFPDGKTIAVKRDGQRSDAVHVRIKAEGLEPGEYVLPLTVAEAGAPDARKTLYYNVTVRRPQLGDMDLYEGGDLFFVFYINTSQYQPNLVDDYYMQKKVARGSTEKWYNLVGNIINLRTVVLDYDAATGRAMLNLGSDMTYVLDHVVKYIRPLQDKGRKVCLSLEGGGKGLGFCNLTPAQIADFTAQVKAVVEQYELDGINLWDRNAGYGKEDMPVTNTTSYPQLIKSLREALGQQKLLTVTVYGTPTETFHDVEASGGIAVGDYIDYAWSGYNRNDEGVQLLDPWNPQLDYVSKYTQQPIANLPKERFGCINFGMYNSANAALADEDKLQFMLDWVPNYQPNTIIVFDDLRSNIQDNYETVWNIMFAQFCIFMDKENRHILGSRAGYTYNLDISRLFQTDSGYGKWQKDW